MATNVSASTAPAVEKVSWMPNQLWSGRPEEPGPAEGQQQGDAAHHRGQHHGQDGQCPDAVSSRELDTEPAARPVDPEHHRQAGRPQRADQ